MPTQGLITLTNDQWRSVEQLSDLLAETADFRQALQAGLTAVLSATGRSGGALYLPGLCEDLADDWTLWQVPAAWNGEMGGLSGVLHGIVQQVMQSGEPFHNIPDLEIAAVLPIFTPARILGVLLVGGPVIAAEDYPFWTALLRPIARFASFRANLNGSVNGGPNSHELIPPHNTLRAMFDSLPIAIYIIDGSYTLVAINHSRAARRGEPAKALVGGRCFEALFGRSSPCLGCRVAETLQNGRTTGRVLRIRQDPEPFIEWEINSFPIFDEQNRPVQSILIEQDITEKRNLEANLMQSEKLAAVGQLAAGVAHEINNPITAILANAQILRREIPAQEKDLLDSVKLIEMASTRASQVIRNLLNLARKETYDFEPIDLNETIENALSFVHHELVGRPIQVALSLGEQMPPVMASEEQIQGVWINLLLNAIDAIHKEPGEILIATRFTGREFQVSIRDNGIGIPAESLARVFEPFFTTKSAGRGTGLGLSVCLGVIRNHGGDIMVESEPGQGTRFLVRLPGP